MGESGGRLVLHAVNAVAADAGLRAGMSQADARAILPELKTSEADPEAEARALVRLSDWCGRFSPWTAPDEEGSGAAFGGGGSLWLDVTGCTHLFGGEKAMMRDIVDRLAGLGFTAYAAVADTPGGAWAAVRHAAPDGRRRREIVVRHGTLRDALAPLPVSGLRLDPATAAGLRAVGLRRIGDLMPIPRAALADRFGSEVADRLDQALGERAEPVSPLAPSAPWVARIAFAEPIGRTEDIADAVRGLARDLAAMLEADGRGARKLTLALYHPDGSVARLEAGTSRASRAAGHLARLFTARLDRIEAPYGIDAITLAATASEPLSASQASLDRRSGDDNGGTGGDAEVAALADRLSNRLGSDRVLQLDLCESHIPERAVATLPMTARASGSTEQDGKPRRLGGRAAAAAARRIQPRALPHALPRPRPLRMLSRPEEIEAIAPVPDDPPVMFRWRKQVFRIAQADGPERIAPEWWAEGFDGFEGSGSAVPAEGSEEDSQGDLLTGETMTGASPVQDNIRDYYRVEDQRGRRFWVYREGVYRPGARPHWYVHGVFG